MNCGAMPDDLTALPEDFYPNCQRRLDLPPFRSPPSIYYLIMTDFVRRLVSGNKARYKDEELDLELGAS